MHTLIAKGAQQQDTAVEPSIAVNPNNPLNAVIGFQAGRVDGGCAQALGYGTTFDGGRTWTWGMVPKLTTSTGGTVPLASDPVIAFGPSNTVYYSELTCPGGGDDLATSVSKDGGKTWGDPIPLPITAPMDDKNWIIVDNGTGLGHHPGRLYLVWDDIAPVLAAYSDDEAKTWQGPFVVYPGQGIGTVPLVMPNGDLTVLFNTIAYAPHVPSDGQPEMPNVSEMIVTTAKGAGAVPTGGPLVFTPPTGSGSDQGNPTPGHRAGVGLPTAGVDPTTSRIYAAWQDSRYRQDGLNDIVVTWSDTFGAAWKKPQPVNPGPRDDSVEHFTPALGVGSDGSVRIAYRTQEQGTDYVDTVYQQSTDGGQTWSAPLVINTGLIPEFLSQDPPVQRPVRTDVRFAAFSRGGAFLGDYSQVATTGSWTYVVRCEAYPTSAEEDENESGPSAGAVHHQRAWVAVVDADGDGIR
jgi:hypothetical protein